MTVCCLMNAQSSFIALLQTLLWGKGKQPVKSTNYASIFSTYMLLFRRRIHWIYTHWHMRKVYIESTCWRSDHYVYWIFFGVFQQFRNNMYTLRRISCMGSFTSVSVTSTSVEQVYHFAEMAKRNLVPLKSTRCEKGHLTETIRYTVVMSEDMGRLIIMTWPYATLNTHQHVLHGSVFTTNFTQITCAQNMTRNVLGKWVSLVEIENILHLEFKFTLRKGNTNSISVPHNSIMYT